MAKTIVGLDIGHWSIKMTKLDLRDHSVISFDEYLHASSKELLEAAPSVPPALPFATARPDGADEAAGGVAAELGEGADDEHEAATPDTPDADEPDDASVWQATLAQIVESGEFIEAELICCNVPANLVTFLQVPVPFDDEDKVATILPSLLDSRLTTDLGQFFWSFYVEKRHNAADDEEGFLARVAVIERSELTEYIEDLKTAGIDPNSLVFAPLAVAEGLNYAGKFGSHSSKGDKHGSSDHTLGPQIDASDKSAGEPSIGLLDFGHSITTLTIIDPSRDNASVTTARMSMFGVHDLASSVAKELGMSTDEVLRRIHRFQGFLDTTDDVAALMAAEAQTTEEELALEQALKKSLRPIVRELRRVLQGLYAQSRLDLSALYLMGGGSSISNLDAELSRQIGIDVVSFAESKIALAPVNDTIRQTMRNPSSWALASNAAELSIRRRTCNFRHGVFAFRGRSSFLQKQIIRGAIALAVILCLIFGILYAQKASLTAQRDAMKVELTKHTKELFGSPIYQKKKIKTLLEGKGQGAEKQLIPTRSAFEIGYDIVSHMPPGLDLNISRFEVDTRRSIVQIRGSTTDAQAVDKLVSSLEEIQCIKDIKKERLTLRGSRADFELQINTEGCS